jgi:hypothetical protein
VVNLLMLDPLIWSAWTLVVEKLRITLGLLPVCGLFGFVVPPIILVADGYLAPSVKEGTRPSANAFLTVTFHLFALGHAGTKQVRKVFLLPST